jgi:2-polyprenyl-6-methoxyphenol hydroxylase-like FAD-dependent oxidoreductase
MEDVLAAGFIPRMVCWRKFDGTFLTGIDGDHLGDHPERMVCLPLNKLGQILYKHLQAQPSADVRFGHKVVAQGQDDREAWVEVELADGARERFAADYVVGCDGANSQIRRTLFGDMAFPGKTWDQQLVATNVYYDFTKFGYEDANFIIDPEHWYMASRISTDGLYRVTYGEPGGFTRDELIARQPMKFETMLPGRPKPEAYKLTNISPYRVHQRLAESLRVGRFLLAADAAHICNPMGGLGLTGGIVDVGNLYDCLIGLQEGKIDDSILDVYSEVRRAKYNEVVNPISSENLVRLFAADPDTVLDTDPFFQMCKKAEKDVEFSKELQNVSNSF